jgi:hypothetical protein
MQNAVGGSTRCSPPGNKLATAWALFEVLYAGRGAPVSGDFLKKAIGASGLGRHLHQLRRALVGSRYRVQAHPDLAYELKIDQD